MRTPLMVSHGVGVPPSSASSYTNVTSGQCPLPDRMAARRLIIRVTSLSRHR